MHTRLPEHKSTWQSQIPEVKTSRCWGKPEINRREISSAVYLGCCHEDSKLQITTVEIYNLSWCGGKKTNTKRIKKVWWTSDKALVKFWKHEIKKKKKSIKTNDSHGLCDKLMYWLTSIISTEKSGCEVSIEARRHLSYTAISTYCTPMATGADTVIFSSPMQNGLNCELTKERKLHTKL